MCVGVTAETMSTHATLMARYWELPASSRLFGVLEQWMCLAGGFLNPDDNACFRGMGAVRLALEDAAWREVDYDGIVVQRYELALQKQKLPEHVDRIVLGKQPRASKKAGALSHLSIFVQTALSVHEALASLRDEFLDDAEAITQKHEALGRPHPDPFERTEIWRLVCVARVADLAITELSKYICASVRVEALKREQLIDPDDSAWPRIRAATSLFAVSPWPAHLCHPKEVAHCEGNAKHKRTEELKAEARRHYEHERASPAKPAYTGLGGIEAAATAALEALTATADAESDGDEDMPLRWRELKLNRKKQRDQNQRPLADHAY